MSYWRDRFGASELKVQELSLLPEKLRDLNALNVRVINDVKILKGHLAEKDEALNFMAQQKAKLEGEMVGSQGFVSKINELECVNKGLMEEIAVWKKKSEEIETNWKNMSKNEQEVNLIKNRNEEKEQRIALLTGEIQRISELLQEKKMRLKF